MTTDDLKETLRKEPKTEYELCRFFAIKQGKTLIDFHHQWGSINYGCPRVDGKACDCIDYVEL